MHEVFKILADSTRLRLLRILRQGDFTVQDLMQILQMGQSRISRHLILMSDAGLLKVDKQGTWRYYRLAPDNPFFQQIWPIMEPSLQDLAMAATDQAGIVRVMSERRRRSQQFFDRHARDWDSLHVALLDLPDYQQDLVALLPAGGVTLEIGVGSGALLPLLAKRAEHTIGIDQSAAMVSLARETVTQQALAGSVDVRLAEMNRLPLVDASVTTVVMNQVLHHAEQPDDVLREISRVLRPEGVLIIADLVRHEHDWVRERLADQWLGFDRQELEGWHARAGLEPTSLQRYENAADGPDTFLLTAIKRLPTQNSVEEEHT